MYDIEITNGKLGISYDLSDLTSNYVYRGKAYVKIPDEFYTVRGKMLSGDN